MNETVNCAQVFIGEYLNFTIGQIQYQQSDASDGLPIYIPIAVVGGVIGILIFLFIIILCVIVRRYREKEKQSEKLFADLQMQLEEMESGLADECKTGNLYYFSKII